jgi:hypothetical protein
MGRGSPAVCTRGVVNVLVLEIAEDGVRAIRSFLNPDKLQHVQVTGTGAMHAEPAIWRRGSP